MQAAAIILTLLAMYAAFLSLCRVAAQAEESANRYRRRVSHRRAAIPAVWKFSNAGQVQRWEVFHGR